VLGSKNHFPGPIETDLGKCWLRSLHQYYPGQQRGRELLARLFVKREHEDLPVVREVWRGERDNLRISQGQRHSSAAESGGPTCVTGVADAGTRNGTGYDLSPGSACNCPRRLGCRVLRIVHISAGECRVCDGVSGRGPLKSDLDGFNDEGVLLANDMPRCVRLDRRL